jgi:uncharacterized membrane protein
VSLLATSGANRCIAGLIVMYVASALGRRSTNTVFFRSTNVAHSLSSLVYLSVMLFFQPYKEQSDSALAGVTQIQLFITLFCTLLLTHSCKLCTMTTLTAQLTCAHHSRRSHP